MTDRSTLPRTVARIHVAALLAVAWSCAGESAARPSVDGLWVGILRQDTQTAPFALRLEASGPDSVGVSVSMPPIGAFDIPVGVAAWQGDTLRLGGWPLVLDRAADVLRGSVPGAIAPVYDLSFELTRTSTLPAGPSGEPAGTHPPRWTLETDAPIWAGVAASGDTVYVANDAGSVLAVSGDDGTVLWSASAGARVRARPTVRGTVLFVHADDGTVTALDRMSGERRWTRTVGEPHERIPPGEPSSLYDHYASSVLVVGDRAVIGLPSAVVVALSVDSGEELWRAPVAGAVHGTPSSDGMHVFYGDMSGAVGALDVNDGRPVWTRQAGGAVVGTPTVAGDRLLIGTRSYDLLAFDRETGAPAWRRYVWFSWVESSVTVSGDRAYVGSSDAQRLFAFDATTGAPHWSGWTEGSTWATPALADGVVYVGTVGVADYITDHRARFHAFDARSGRATWRYEMSRPEGAAAWGFASSPVAGESGVFVGGTDGRLYAF